MKRGTGSAGQQYHPVREDVGTALRAEVTLAKAGYRTTTLTGHSEPVAALAFSPGTLKVNGLLNDAPMVDEQLTGSIDAGVSDAEIRYEWRYQGHDETFTGTAFTPAGTALGRTLEIRAVLNASGYTEHTTSWTSLGEVAAATLTPGPITVAGLIDGTSYPDAPLQAALATGHPDAQVTYEWRTQPDGVMVGSASDFTPRTAQVGSALEVRATVNAVGYTEFITPWHNVGTVTALRDTLSPVTLAATVATQGRFEVGAKVGAKVSKVPAEATITYIWRRGAKTVATTREYRLTSADLGKRLTVTAQIIAPGATPATRTASTPTVTPKVRFSKAKVKAKKTQKATVAGLPAKTKIVVKIRGKKVATLRTTGTGKVKVVKVAPYAGYRIKVRPKRAGFTVSFNVGPKKGNVPVSIKVGKLAASKHVFKVRRR